MPEPTSILLPLLELLRDGRPHLASELERELQKTFPLALRCGSDAMLLKLQDDGCLIETSFDRFAITTTGLGRLDMEREAAQSKSQQKRITAQKQRAMF